MMLPFRLSMRDLSAFCRDVAIMGKEVQSERGLTFELEGCSFAIENPLDRIATESWRKINIGFAITESLSYMVGDGKLEPISQFIPSYSAFSTNGRTIDGAYGPRLHELNQLQTVIAMLMKTPETRRAVMSIYLGLVDLHGGGGLNTPCTLNLQFLVRDGKLNMHVMMRSNDVILGLTNDVFAFTMLQEYVSIRTGIPLGNYYHYASSMHLYKSDLVKFPIRKTGKSWNATMSPMNSGFEPSAVYHQISELPRMGIDDVLKVDFMSQYNLDLFLSAALVAKRNEGATQRHAMAISDSTLRMVTNRWLKED